MAFYAPRNISPADQLLFDANGNAVGIQAAGSSSQPVLGMTPAKAAAVDSLVSADGIAGRTAPMLSALAAAVGAWSHTRATANASVVDCFGSMQFALSGERRFRGARRVCNVIGDTEGLETAWTLGSNSTKAAAPYRSPNHSRPSAWTVTRTSGAVNMLTRYGVSYRPGKWCFSMWIRGDGVQTYTLAINATTQTVTPPAGVWTRCAVVADLTSTAGINIYVTNATSGAATLTLCDPQMEWVHNQASPAPSDYVPQGVAGFPSALLTAGVDGVRYHETSNPWVLSSGIATRTATVVPIDPSLMLGMQFDPIETNQVFSSRDISAAEWSKTGSTTVNATAGNSTLLGVNSIFKMEEAAASSGYRVTQSWRGANPAVNSALSVSFYCKAAERSIAYIGLRQLDGATFTYAYFNLASGTVSNVTAGCTAYMYREGDLWRVCFTGPAGASGSTAPLIQVGMCITAGTQTYTGTLASGMWFGAIQFEDHGCPTSYIGDTGSAATLSRNADSTSVTLTDCPAIDFTLSCEVTPFFQTDTPWKDSWWYLMSSYVNGQDRNAFGWRPNTFGGAGAGMGDEWFFDLYPNLAPAASSWDGVEILAGAGTIRAGETVPVQWSLASEGRTSGTSSAAGPGTTNQTARVGNVAATMTGDTPRPATNSLGSVPRTYWFGKQGEFLPQRGSFCVRNLKWQRLALTAAQMAEVAP